MSIPYFSDSYLDLLFMLWLIFLLLTKFLFKIYFKARFLIDFYRACPECRVNSNFVTPSKYWVDTDDEKNKIIGGYKEALRYR